MFNTEQTPSSSSSKPMNREYVSDLVWCNRCVFLIILGWFARPTTVNHGHASKSFLRDFLDEMKAENIKQHLRCL